MINIRKFVCVTDEVVETVRECLVTKAILDELKIDYISTIAVQSCIRTSLFDCSEVISNE